MIKRHTDKGTCPKRAAIRRVAMQYLLNGGENPKAYIKTHSNCLSAALMEDPAEVEGTWWSIMDSLGWARNGQKKGTLNV